MTSFIPFQNSIGNSSAGELADHVLFSLSLIIMQCETGFRRIIMVLAIVS